MERDSPQRVGRVVVVTFAATALAFCAAAIATLLLGWGIDRDARAITRNATPSVTALGNMRTELRHLEIIVDDVIDRRAADGVAAADLKVVSQARHELFHAWEDYLARPTFPEELLLRPAIAQDLALLQASIDATIGAPRADAAAALERLKRDGDRLDRDVNRLQRYNAAQNDRLADDIHRTFRRAIVVAIGAGALVLALMLFVAIQLSSSAQKTAQLLADRAAELDAFAGRVAHDLASPLAATMLTLSLARESLPPDGRLPALMERMTATLKRVQALVRDLYDYAAAGGHPDRAARADVAEVLRGVVEQARSLAAERDAEISIAEANGFAVACRPGVLVSIAGNLIDNALKHMTATQPERRIAVRVADARDCVRVEIEDSGPGIAADDLARLFQPYTRGHTAATGLGLGLATVKRLTERHGGRVGARSMPGRGSTFWFELPKAA